MVKSERCMFAQSVQGASHSKKEESAENKELGQKFPCQDKSCSQFFPADTSHKTPYYLTVACDGHGGAPYFRSARGAELAIASIKKILPAHIDEIARLLKDIPYDYSLVQESCDKVHIDDAAVHKNILSMLVPSLLTEWKRMVDSDRTENPITEEELKFLEREDKQAADYYRDALASGYCDKANEVLRPIYGTTFLCFVAAEHFWFAVQIGDGDIAVHNKTGFFMPVPEDERNFLNQTTSLCDKDAEHEFRIAFGTCKIDAVFCSTDGIANSFANKGQLFTFYQRILSLFRTYNFGSKQVMGFFDFNWKTAAKKQVELANDEINSSLPDISKRGSGDDVTLAGFVDISKDDIKNALKAAKLVEEGKKAKEMPDKAEKKFREAADLGSPEGCYRFGYMIRQKSPKTAIGYLAKAIEGGIKEAKEPIAVLLFEEAQALQQTGNHADAFKYFLKSAEYGMKEAQYEVSLYFGRPQDYEHCGVRQNFAEAIRWTFAAAKQGHPEAECKLGKCYRDGRGIQQDEELSLEWYKKAGEHGSLEAQNYLKQLEAKENEM
ncbi:protein phosphatase 2C domain-containing protein [Treponema sp. OMZ 788]|uniref:protein phosphatase 2C domain-containing protein n=1 Tax=Treponema sp. OMZ 788 TaxID=2563664 RepID=UPI0020A2D0F7|nr:protein phosphatase 2C domain-containing protein [Treponema sp. OMZ 788]UTC64133.1 protein phosphatase 2C domain-containing protein [Treponema sp. OMZ 788]